MKALKRKPLILALAPVDAPQASDPIDAPAPDAGLEIPQAAAPVEAATPPLPPPAEPSAAERRRLARAERAAARTLPPPKAAARERAEAGPWLARWAYPIAALSAVVWIGALGAFVAGYERRAWAFDYAPFRLAIALGLALLPAAFILLSAYMIRQGARFAAEARRARSLSDDLSTPAMLAAAQAGGAAQAVREEVGRVKAVADEASRRMAELRQTLAEESRLLTEAAGTAERSARTLGGRLQSERAELGGLVSSLDAQAAASAEGLARQSRLVTDASDLAQAQMAEAEAALTSRTADLLAAASTAERAASGAGDELGRQNGRLERLARQLAEERDGLAAATETLFANQDEILARTESQRARLAAAAVAARDGALHVVEAADAGAESLKALIGEAGVQVRTLTDSAAEARAAMESDTHEALERLRDAAESVVASAASSAAALTAQADAAGRGARAQVDELAQAAFDAGQRADQAFDTRLAAARRAIDAQAALVEEAGLRAATRIEAGLGAARSTLGEMEGLVAELEARLAQAPDEARARVEALRGAVEAGVEGVSAAARRAAADTEAVDSAFQDRVRKTYATLTDAVRVMGRVSDAAEAAASAQPAPAPPKPASRPSLPKEDEALFPTLRAMAFPEREPVRAVASGLAGAALANPEAPASPRSPTVLVERAAPDPSVPVLRTRLRLAPTAEDAEVRALFEVPTAAETAAPEASAQADNWSWKDLLGGMDDEGSIDDEALAERMLGEITGMGVDPGALLPRARIDEIARTVQAGEAGQAREAVRRLAPAAVRRLSRRVMTDRVLRGQADLYRRRYGDLLREAGKGDEEGAATQALLGSDPGRAYLLLEAAAADLH